MKSNTRDILKLFCSFTPKAATHGLQNDDDKPAYCVVRSL